jgi:hypothetical protein
MTGLDFQVVDVKFDKGLETKTQPKLVIPGKWNQLNNLSLQKDKTPRRRDGVATLVAGANGNGLATHNAELLTVAGGAVASVSLGTSPATAVAVGGTLGYVGVSKQEIQRSTGMQDSCDVATGGGFTCYVWRNLDGAAVQQGLNVSLFDETTGAVMLSNATLIANTVGFCPRVVFSGGAFFITYISGTSLRCRVILVTTPTTLGAEVALVTSASLAGLNFDSCAQTLTNPGAFVVYGWTDTVTSVRCLHVKQVAGVPSVDLGPSNVFAEASLPIATLSALSCAPFNSATMGVFALSTGAAALSGLAGVLLDSTYTATAGPSQLDATTPTIAAQNHVTAVLTTGGMQVLWDSANSYNTAAFSPLRSVLVSASMGALAGPVTIISSASFGGGATEAAGPQGPFIAGKAFVSGLNAFLPVSIAENYQGAAFISPNGLRVTNNQQNSLFVLDVTGASSGTAPVVVGKALYGAYGVAAVNNNKPRVSTPCSTPAVTGGFALACTERTLLSFVDGFNLSPTGVVRLTLAPNTTVAPIRVQLGESTYFAGGSPTAYDGQSLTETAFHVFPEGVSLELVGGGGAMTAGVHQVVVIAEFIDNAGQRYQSAPNLPVSITTALNDRIRVRAPSLLLSQKSGIRLVAFVTQAAGTTFNRVGSIGAGAAGTANDPTASTTTLALVDQADAVYAGNELLYTQPDTAGTALPNIAPGPMSSMVVHQNRLFFDRADQPGQFAYSQPYENNVGLQFNDELTGTVDSTGGGIVGWASMDEKLVLFCARRPYVIYGAGPDSSGAGSAYADPQELPSDVGCSEARSILKTPVGVMFKSLKGWYLMGRDLVCRYIGAGVSQYDANPVSSAVMLADQQECRFGSTSGVQLIYDYVDDQWSTSTISAGVAPYAVADAAWWPTGGYYASISLTQALNHDTPGVYLDSPGGNNAAPIVTTGRTAFLHPGAIKGFQRVRRLLLTGTCTTAPTSTLNIAVDYDDAYGGAAPGAYNFSTVLSTIVFPAGMPIDVRTKLRRQKCDSIAFTFTDTPTADSPGVNFQALAMEIGMKRGVNKLPSTQSVG